MGFEFERRAEPLVAHRSERNTPAYQELRKRGRPAIEGVPFHKSIGDTALFTEQGADRSSQRLVYL